MGLRCIPQAAVPKTGLRGQGSHTGVLSRWKVRAASGLSRNVMALSLLNLPILGAEA